MSGSRSAEPPEPPEGLMTTKEVAAYLRIKERRVYELVRQRAIPCTRVTGKWLFPKREVDQWLAGKLEGETAAGPGLPPVIAGSHDPLLDWAVRESRCGLALLPGGSLDGLARFARGGALIAGLHLRDPDGETYNLAAVQEAMPLHGLVLVEWAWRQQGLLLAAGRSHDIKGLQCVAEKGLKVVLRQPESGAQRLLLEELAAAGLALSDLAAAPAVAGSETDLGLAILEGRADAGIAVESVARSLKLGFVPLRRERYDLLLRRRDYFEAPFQSLLRFAAGDAFRARAAEMGGYDIGGLGRIHLNGP